MAHYQLASSGGRAADLAIPAPSNSRLNFIPTFLQASLRIRAAFIQSWWGSCMLCLSEPLQATAAVRCHFHSTVKAVIVHLSVTWADPALAAGPLGPDVSSNAADGPPDRCR